MPFPASITQSLQALEESFDLPAPAARWWQKRARRFGMARRARNVSQAWRQLNAALQAAGAPLAPWPVVVDHRSGYETNCFLKDMLSGRTKLVMCSWDTALSRLDVPDTLLPLGNVVVLLHEQAHARLSNCLQGWEETLPAELRFYMDWLWEQAPGFPGRKVFHELYADASAVAWTLLLGQHGVEAQSVARALLQMRRDDMNEAQAEGIFSPHSTMAAIEAVLNLPADELARAPEEQIQRVTVDAFRAWLDQGGRQECEAFVEAYRQMSFFRIYGLVMAGRLPVHQVFGESERHYHGLVKLARELPDHPLLRFDQAQYALSHNGPLGLQP